MKSGMRSVGHVCASVLLFVLLQSGASAAPQLCPDNVHIESARPLKVGVRYAPPFVFNNEKKGWQGLSVDLWETISMCLGTRHEYIEFATTDELLEAVASHKVDVGVSALSITSEREKTLDFSYGYYKGSLGVIVPDVAANRTFMDVLKKYFRFNVLCIVLGLILTTILIAYTYWRFESKRGNKFFADGPAQGFYNAMIWSIQLVFSGRGDPFSIRNRGGQLFVLFLTFFGVTIVSGVTAIITSSLTLQGIEWHIQNVADLKKQNIAVMGTGPAKDWAVSEKLYIKQFRSWPEVQRAFDEKTTNVFVHDRDILQFLIQDHYLKNVRVEPLSFNEDAYGIALPMDSALRKPINRSLLAIQEDRVWSVLTTKYLGQR